MTISIIASTAIKTGTTMEACAYALHKKGAASVTGFVIASGAL